MNAEELEQKLERAPLRLPPVEWRRDILAVARESLPAERATETRWIAGLRALIARVPAAWGALAALWLVILGVNSFLSGSEVATMPNGPLTASSDSPTLWNLQRKEVILLADHFDKISKPLPRRAKSPIPPRSDRRREDGFGGLRTDCDAATFA